MMHPSSLKEDVFPLLEATERQEATNEKSKVKTQNISTNTKNLIFYSIIISISLLLVYLIYHRYAHRKDPSAESIERFQQAKDLSSTVFEVNEKRFLATECFLTNPTAEDVIQENSHDLPYTTINKNLCQGADARNCAVKLKPVAQHYFVIEKIKSLVCPIAKNFSTVLAAIVCLLNDETNVLKTTKSLLDRQMVSGKCMQKEMSSWSLAESTYIGGSHDWSPLTIVREPIDRFLSGYMYTCLRGMQNTNGCTRYCFGCGQNMTCYLEQLYKRVMIASKSSSNRIDKSEIHMIPQNWYCDFHAHLSQYKLLHYHSDPAEMFNQLKIYFQARNVSEEALHFIRKSITKKRTGHSTVNMDYRQYLENRLKQSPYLMNMIKRIYYHDYKLFGYNIDY